MKRYRLEKEKLNKTLDKMSFPLKIQFELQTTIVFYINKLSKILQFLF